VGGKKTHRGRGGRQGENKKEGLLNPSPVYVFSLLSKQTSYKLNNYSD